MWHGDERVILGQRRLVRCAREIEQFDSYVLLSAGFERFGGANDTPKDIVVEKAGIVDDEEAAVGQRRRVDDDTGSVRRLIRETHRCGFWCFRFVFDFQRRELAVISREDAVDERARLDAFEARVEWHLSRLVVLDCD